MIIGLTGGIASGKSTVCKALEDAGFIHIDADDVAHSVLEEPEVIGRAVELFGNDVLYARDDVRSPLMLDRKELGKIVFADAEKMALWEGVTHPRVVERIKEMIAADPDKNYVIEAIALIKSGLISICDELWVVHAEPEQQISRLMSSRGLTREEAIARLESQKDHDWDESKADHVIYSTEPVETMMLQVTEALKTCYD